MSNDGLEIIKKKEIILLDLEKKSYVRKSA